VIFNPLGDVVLRTGSIGGLSAVGNIALKRRKKVTLTTPLLWVVCQA